MSKRKRTDNATQKKKNFLIEVWHSESTRTVADATETSVETREGEGFVVKII